MRMSGRWGVDGEVGLDQHARTVAESTSMDRYRRGCRCARFRVRPARGVPASARDRSCDMEGGGGASTDDAPTMMADTRTHTVAFDAGIMLDRCAAERRNPRLVESLRTDPRTQWVHLRGDTAAVRTAVDGRPSLLSGPLAGHDGPALFLGRNTDGIATIAVLDPGDDAGENADHAAAGGAPAVDGTQGPEITWAGLRDIGPSLSALDVDRFMTALALSSWHARHPRCPRCGQPTTIELAGWIRRCQADGSEHYPRTDPAVIVAITDPGDRLLLARAPAWPRGRRSVLAGFVEPGEHLEWAVAREVHEEVGVTVDDITYVDSQPWPFPASLMLGFRARTDDPALRLDPGEIAEAEWYTRKGLRDAVAGERLLLPGRLSIARRLVEGWFGERIDPPTEVSFHRPS